MRVVLLGAGGFAREVFEWMQGSADAFYSDNAEPGQMLRGKPVVSSLEGFTHFVAAVGHPGVRERLWWEAIAAGVHSLGVEMRNGVRCPGVRVSPDVTIGKGVIFNLNVTVGHDTVIEDFVTVSPGANISGCCRIGRGAYIGTGSAIREGVRIGAGAIVGMGAAVIRDVPAGETWGGVPAKRIK
jgi:sugar O-acyltransferase (sialic acid O-acetyltransferase NeuD family)